MKRPTAIVAAVVCAFVLGACAGPEDEPQLTTAPPPDPQPLKDFVFQDLLALEYGLSGNMDIELFSYADMSHRLDLPQDDLSDLAIWSVVSICANGSDTGPPTTLIRAGVIQREYLTDDVKQEAEAGNLLPVDCEDDWQTFP